MASAAQEAVEVGLLRREWDAVFSAVIVSDSLLLDMLRAGGPMRVSRAIRLVKDHYSETQGALTHGAIGKAFVTLWTRNK